MRWPRQNTVIRKNIITGLRDSWVCLLEFAGNHLLPLFLHVRSFKHNISCMATTKAGAVESYPSPYCISQPNSQAVRAVRQLDTHEPSVPHEFWHATKLTWQASKHSVRVVALQWLMCDASISKHCNRYSKHVLYIILCLVYFKRDENYFYFK